MYILLSLGFTIFEEGGVGSLLSEMQVEMHVLYDKHHSVLFQSHQNTHNSAKYEVIGI